jgi:hypothetical protein
VFEIEAQRGRNRRMETLNDDDGGDDDDDDDDDDDYEPHNM